MSTELNIPLFEGLTEEQRSELFALATRKTYDEGDAIVAEGDTGRGLFVLVDGIVVVEKATISGVAEILTELSSGECFGELALVDSEPRSATVRSKGRAEVEVFQQQDLDTYFERHPEVHRRILENLVLISAQRLRLMDETLVQSAYDSIIVIDSDCRILERKKMTDRGGLISDTAAVTHIAGEDLFDVVPNLGAGIRKQLVAVMATGKREVFALEHVRGEQTYHFEVTVAPDGGARAALGIRNVTETKSLENLLIQSEKLAMTGQMASEIGHELRNHLTVLIGHIDLLGMVEAVKLSEKANRSVEIVSTQLEKIERFASGLMELGALKLNKQPSDLNDLIRKLIRFIQGQSRFQKCTFELDLNEDLPPVPADPGQMQQVLLNLYANAADAAGSCNIITTSRHDQDANLVILAVRDNGPGMPQEVANRVFDSGFTTKADGHGHGLAICRRIIENHAGSVAVETKLGEGTAFTLTFRL